MNIKKFVLQTTNILKNAGIESAKLDTDLFICEYFNWQWHDIILNEEKIISSSEVGDINKWVLRRLEGEPVAYIFGYKHFYKHKFLVNKNVLIPRPETELMVEFALDWLKVKRDLNIIDIGSGSGCLGLSVLSELNQSRLTLVDISAEALSVAEANAKCLGVEENCLFINKDINKLERSLYKNNFDIVLANPPYIDQINGFVEKNVKKYEPSIALFAEEKGLKEIRSWIILSESLISNNGLLLMEFGERQSQEVQKYLKERSSYKKVTIHKDYAGLPRFVSAVRD